MATPGASSASPVTEARASEPSGAKLRWQEATITAVMADTPKVKSFLLAPSASFPFRAGQHVDVRLTAPDGYRAERSILHRLGAGRHRAHRAQHRAARRRRGLALLHDVAEIGDAIELRGPIGGHFVWDVNDGGPLLLLGGGSGVVPLMSMLRHRAAVMSDVPALLLFSSRTFDDVIVRDGARARCAQ